MRIRNLDTNDDWTFGKGLQDYAIDEAGILLNLKTRLLSFLGDCFFAKQEGIDWFNFIGSKNLTPRIEIAVTKVINNSEGITEVILLDFFQDSQTRALTFNYTVSTVFSTNVQETIILPII